MRFGQAVCRGGVIIDKLVGIAVEAIGCKALMALKDRLDAPECREVIRALEAIDSGAEPAEKVLAQERHWSRKTFGWRGTLIRLIRPGMLQPIDQNLIRKLRQAELQRRRLLLSFAHRAYELEKGGPPKTVNDLAPHYLKAIPLDPDTGKSLN